MNCKSRVWTMFVNKWGARVTAQVVSGQAEWFKLMQNNVRYICTDYFGYDLYEHNETGELFATQGNVWGSR